jgi:hypothetical protein
LFRKSESEGRWPLRFRAPGNSPNWFSSFLATLQRVLSKADRQNIKFLRKDFTKADAGTTLSLGLVPGNAVIIEAISGVSVHEVFNAGTNNRFNMGTAASTAAYGSARPLTALGFVPLNIAANYRPSTTTDATEIKIVVDVTGVAATTGKATAMVAYIVSQEG